MLSRMLRLPLAVPVIVAFSRAPWWSGPLLTIHILRKLGYACEICSTDISFLGHP